MKDILSLPHSNVLNVAYLTVAPFKFWTLFDRQLNANSSLNIVMPEHHLREHYWKLNKLVNNS